MKKILVPVDFSDCSKNALKFAFEVASVFGSEIDVLHTFTSPSSAGRSMSHGLEDTIREAAEEDMNKLVQEFEESYQNIVVKAAVIYGRTADVVGSIIDKNDFEMVIMGTTGASGLKEFFLGSTASSLIDEIRIPLLVVPEKSEFKKWDEFILASDLEKINSEKHLMTLKELASSFQAKVKVVTYKDNHEENSDDKELKDFFSEYDYSYEVIPQNSADDLETMLLKFSENPNAILALTHRPRGFFMRIFDPSFSKQMAMHTKNPILILQDA